MKNLFEVHHRLIGEENQQKIEASKVVIVGVGGLGCTVAQNSVRLGVTAITLIDPDKIECSNLPRQILFTESDVNKYKADVAKEKLASFSSKVQITAHPKAFTSKNGTAFLEGAQVVIDCTDNYVSRYAISKIAKELQIPMIYGGVQGFEGQIGVFNYKGSKGFHEVFPNLNTLLETETCEASGVLPFVVQTVGALQVAEFYKICVDDEAVLNNKLLCVNVLNGKQRVLRL